MLLDNWVISRHFFWKMPPSRSPGSSGGYGGGDGGGVVGARLRGSWAARSQSPPAIRQPTDSEPATEGCEGRSVQARLFNGVVGQQREESRLQNTVPLLPKKSGALCNPRPAIFGFFLCKLPHPIPLPPSSSSQLPHPLNFPILPDFAPRTARSITSSHPDRGSSSLSLCCHCHAHYHISTSARFLLCRFFQEQQRARDLISPTSHHKIRRDVRPEAR